MPLKVELLDIPIQRGPVQSPLNMPSKNLVLKLRQPILSIREYQFTLWPTNRVYPGAARVCFSFSDYTLRIYLTGCEQSARAWGLDDHLVDLRSGTHSGHRSVAVGFFPCAGSDEYEDGRCTVRKSNYLFVPRGFHYCTRTGKTPAARANSVKSYQDYRNVWQRDNSWLHDLNRVYQYVDQQHSYGHDDASYSTFRYPSIKKQGRYQTP